MTAYPTPVTIAAGPLHAALRLQSVLTVEAVEAALDDVYQLWESRGMFGCDDDLDAAAAIIDLARHAIYDNRGNLARARTKEVLFSEDAGRLVREWEQRKRAAADPTPTSVRVHESNAQFAAHMLRALPDAAIDRRTEAGLSCRRERNRARRAAR